MDFNWKDIPVMGSFITRDAEMKLLRRELLPVSTDEVRRKVVVLHGPRESRKREFAAEFIRKHHASYSAVFWIDGSTKTTLEKGVADLVNRLPQTLIPKTMKNSEMVDEMLRWLSQPLNTRWLLVFDNVDPGSTEDSQAFSLENYFPKANQGFILVISQLTSLCRLGTCIKLKSVDELHELDLKHKALKNKVSDLDQRQETANFWRSKHVIDPFQICQKIIICSLWINECGKPPPFEIWNLPRSKFRFFEKYNVSLGDRLKKALENYSGEEWNWWPLDAPRRRLRPGNVRIEWECVSRTSQNWCRRY